LIVPNYHEIAEHFKFINQDKDLDGGATKDDEGNFDIDLSVRIDSMSIIYNMTGDEPMVTMIIASDSWLHAKIINIRSHFTRMLREEAASPRIAEWNSLSPEIAKKNVNYGKMLKQDDWVDKKSSFG